MALFGRLFGRGYEKKPGGGYDVGPGKKAARQFGRPLFGGGKPTPAERMKILQAQAKVLGQPVPKPVAVPQPITLGRSEPPTGQRTTVGVPHGLVTAFIAGTLTYVTSSWLNSAQYDQREQELTITFLDGHREIYGDINETEAASFYAAPSKGGWVHDYLLGPRLPGGTYTGLKPHRPG